MWLDKNGYSSGFIATTMCSYDGTDIFELVGIYMLSDCWFSRYDGLLTLRNINEQKVDRTSKSIMKIFKDVGFSIDKETNLKVAWY